MSTQTFSDFKKIDGVKYYIDKLKNVYEILENGNKGKLLGRYKKKKIIPI